MAATCPALLGQDTVRQNKALAVDGAGEDECCMVRLRSRSSGQRGAPAQ